MFYEECSTCLRGMSLPVPAELFTPIGHRRQGKGEQEFSCLKIFADKIIIAYRQQSVILTNQVDVKNCPPACDQNLYLKHNYAGAAGNTFRNRPCARQDRAAYYLRLRAAWI